MLKKIIESVREITDLSFEELRNLRQEITEIIAFKAKEEFKVGTLVRKVGEFDDNILWVIVAIQHQFEIPRLVLYPKDRVESPTEIVNFDKIEIVEL